MRRFARLRKDAVVSYKESVKEIENLSPLFKAGKNTIEDLDVYLKREYGSLNSVETQLDASSEKLDKIIEHCQSRISELESTIARQEEALDDLNSELENTDPVYRYTDRKGNERERPNFDYLNLERKIYEKSNKIAANYARLEIVANELDGYLDIDCQLSDVKTEIINREVVIQEAINDLTYLRTEYDRLNIDVIDEAIIVEKKLSSIIGIVDLYLGLKIENQYLDDKNRIFRTKEHINTNSEFVRNRYEYQTDHLGRTVSVSGQLYLPPKTSRKMEDISVMWEGHKLKSDDRGHIIGHQFGGSDSAENLFPQDMNINRNEYAAFENQLRGYLEDEKDVYVSFSLRYSDDSKRPDSLIVFYSVDGKKMFKQFTNAPQENVA